jgi:hypothetical protein
MVIPRLFVAADVGVIEALASSTLLQLFRLLGNTPQQFLNGSRIERKINQFQKLCKLFFDAKRFIALYLLLIARTVP